MRATKSGQEAERRGGQGGLHRGRAGQERGWGCGRCLGMTEQNAAPPHKHETRARKETQRSPEETSPTQNDPSYLLKCSQASKAHVDPTELWHTATPARGRARCARGPAEAGRSNRERWAGRVKGHQLLWQDYSALALIPSSL